MTRKEAQQILERIDRLDAKVERWSKQLSRCKAMVQPMTAGTSMQDVIVQGGVRSSGAEWDDYLKASAEYDKAVDAYVLHRDTVMAVLDRMEHVMQARVLDLRYLSRPRMGWVAISKKLHYTERHVYRLNQEALESFGEEWEKLWGCPTRQ
mgnify:CR=1 FL=1